MMVFDHGVVVSSVVRNEETPTSLIAMILARSVKQITMEEECVARIHLKLHSFEQLLCVCQPSLVNLSLTASHIVRDETHSV